MTARFTESVVAEAALDYFRELRYAIFFGAAIAPEEPVARPHAVLA